jgi:peptidoglycan/LPS O-acetylase OafA/YrhL
LPFPLYLIHFPVLCLASALSPFDRGGTLDACFLAGVVAFTAIAATPVCDALKLTLRRALGGHRVQ